jgi:microcystin-dependent protein
MSTPYVGEIRMFGFQRIPVGWQACDGSLLPIDQFSTLYTVIGTAYGGDGTTSFGVPDLRGRIPIHEGTGPGRTTRVLGERSGAEQVTLTVNQIPPHNHLVTVATAPATAASPGSSVILAQGAADDQLYFTPPTGGVQEPMAQNSGQLAGGGLGHNNCAPTLTVSFCIAFDGIFPSQS